MSTAFGRELTPQYLEGFYANLATMGGGARRRRRRRDAALVGRRLARGRARHALRRRRLGASGASDAANGAYYADGAQYADGVAQYTSGVDGIAGGADARAPRRVAKYTTGVGGTRPTGIGQRDTTAAQSTALGAAAPTSRRGSARGVAQIAQVGARRRSSTRARDGQPAPRRRQLSRGDTARARARPDCPRLERRHRRRGIRCASSSPAGRGAARGRRHRAFATAPTASLRASTNSPAASARSHTGHADAATARRSSRPAQARSPRALTTAPRRRRRSPTSTRSTTAEVVSEPVTVEATRDNRIESTGEVIGMLFVPIGLWLGAMAMFLVFRPFGREALRSTASTGGLVVAHARARRPARPRTGDHRRAAPARRARRRLEPAAADPRVRGAARARVHGDPRVPHGVASAGRACSSRSCSWHCSSRHRAGSTPSRC